MALSLGTVDRNSVAWSLARSQRLNTWIGPYRMPAARAPSRSAAKAACRAFAPEDERLWRKSRPWALTIFHRTGPLKTLPERPCTGNSPRGGAQGCAYRNKTRKQAHARGTGRGSGGESDG